MESQKYDVIVIGAGPAGLMWSTEVVKSGKSVLLIDKGHQSDHSYSAIASGWHANPNIILGGIGGTANAWQGQSLLLDKEQFSVLAVGKSAWNFQKYSALSIEVASILKINIENSFEKYIQSIHSHIKLSPDIKIKISFMPLTLSWTKIFFKTLKSKKLLYQVRELSFIETSNGFVSNLNFTDGTTLSVPSHSQVVLAMNPISTVKVLKKSEILSKCEFPNIGYGVYDHPWMTRLRFEPNRNAYFRRSEFRYQISARWRMRTKLKFEVSESNSPVGVFELRPVFQKKGIKKILNRLCLNFLNRTPFQPTYVDVWCQIAMINRLTPSANPNPDLTLSKPDKERMNLVEQAARETLLASGLIECEPDSEAKPEQAFHPSGTIEIGNDWDLHSFNFDGKSNKYSNLFLAGSAGLGNMSWINPTFSIMVFSAGNARASINP